jgi:hypothetical protein
LKGLIVVERADVGVLHAAAGSNGHAGAEGPRHEMIRGG